MPDKETAGSVSLMGLEFARRTEAEAGRDIIDALDREIPGWVLTANLDILRRWVREPSFRSTTKAVTLCVADGAPVVWASRLQGCPVPERVTGSNLFISLSGLAAQRGHSIYLLGGAPGTADSCATLLKQKFPALNVAGTHSPDFGFEQNPAAMQTIRDKITQARPDIVYVALGSPKQEILIDQVRDLLPGAWWLGVGASFSFLAGDMVRAPQWMQRVGLEWLHRLLREPTRLARRYLGEDLPFLFRLLSNALRKRWTGRDSGPNHKNNIK